MLNRKTAIAAALSIMCAGAMASPAPLASLALGASSGGMAFDPVLGYAFVTNYGDGTLSAIDVDTLTVTATIPAGENPRRIVSNAALSRLYLVNDTAPGQLTVLDTTSNDVLARVNVGDRPRNIAADFKKGEVYVSNHDSNTISIVDVATNSVVATVPTGRGPGGIEVDTRLGRLYVASARDGIITVIDQNTRDVHQTVAVGRNPGATTVDERTGKVYVNNVDDKTVSVLDRDGNVVATLPVGAGSTFGTVSATYHRYYLPNAADGTLTIVDTDYDVVTSTIAVGASPQQAIVDAALGKIYVVNRVGNTVAVVDALTESVADSLDVGASPWRIASAMGKLFVLNENGDAPDSLSVAAEPQTADPTAIVTEYHHQLTGRYFHSVDPVENRLLNDGVFGNEWNRTMQFWRAWTHPAPGRLPFCRFHGAGLGEATNAPSTRSDEASASDTWHYDGVSCYYVAVPDASGECSYGTVPLYRLHDDASADAANDRFAVDPAVRAAMQHGGWVTKGKGPDAVFACVPALRGKADLSVGKPVRPKPIVRPMPIKRLPGKIQLP